MATLIDDLRAVTTDPDVEFTDINAREQLNQIKATLESTNQIDIVNAAMVGEEALHLAGIVPLGVLSQRSTVAGDTGQSAASAINNSPENRLKWRYSFSGLEALSPTVVGTTVYVGDGNGQVAALDAASGEAMWQASIGGFARPSQNTEGDKIYFSSHDGVHALNIESGDEEWHFDAEGIRAAPFVNDGSIYFGTIFDDFYALDTDTGEELWRRNEISVITEPTVQDGVVYISSRDGPVLALDAATGEEKWRQTQIHGRTSPIVHDGTVYVAHYNIIALDADTGEEIRQYTVGSSVGSAPTIVENTLYYGTNSEKVHAVDVETGEELWRYATKGRIWTTPAVQNGIVCVGSRDGHLYALNAKTGQERWRYGVNYPIHSDPTSRDNAVYVSSLSGVIYALKLKLAPPTAVISADRMSGTPGQTIEFDASDSEAPDGDIVTYEWDFGDGTTQSDAAIVEHTYDQAGEYTVTLAVVDDNELSDSTEATVVIEERSERSYARLLEELYGILKRVVDAGQAIFVDTGRPLEQFNEHIVTEADTSAELRDEFERQLELIRKVTGDLDTANSNLQQAAAQFNTVKPNIKELEQIDASALEQVIGNYKNQTTDWRDGVSTLNAYENLVDSLLESMESIDRALTAIDRENLSDSNSRLRNAETSLNEAASAQETVVNGINLLRGVPIVSANIDIERFRRSIEWLGRLSESLQGFVTAVIGRNKGVIASNEAGTYTVPEGQEDWGAAQDLYQEATDHFQSAEDTFKRIDRTPLPRDITTFVKSFTCETNYAKQSTSYWKQAAVHAGNENWEKADVDDRRGHEADQMIESCWND